MELIPFLSTVILVATIATIIFAVFSYLAYRARERKLPRVRARSGDNQAPIEPQFFKRYQPREH